jgi:excisionase family DNA binding protein
MDNKQKLTYIIVVHIYNVLESKMKRPTLAERKRRRISKALSLSAFKTYHIGKSDISPGKLAIFETIFEIDQENDSRRVPRHVEVYQNTLLTPSEVAGIFDVSSSTIMREARNGKIKGYKLGNRYKFPVHCLIEFASRQLSN